MPAWAEAIASLVGRDRADRAAEDAIRYFSSFTGRLFDRLAGESPPWRFTAGDLYAVATLSAPIAPATGAMLLDELADRCSDLLDRVPVDCAIRDLRAAHVLGDGGPAAELYALLRSQGGIGRTRASKLMAVKRPALIPIRDSHVERALGAIADPRWWAPMVHAWSDPVVPAAVQDLRDAVAAKGGELPGYVTDLRLVDVVIWCSFRS